MDYVIEVLERQNNALLQLMEYMKKEYDLLVAGNPEPLAHISFAMQDCLHSIEQERNSMLKTIGTTITDYCATLSENDAKRIHSMMQIIQSQEQMCKEQSEHNRAIALGMIEQCRQNISFIQDTIATHVSQGYMPSGAIQKTIVQGSLLEGRL